MDQHLNAFMDLGPDVAPRRIADATHAAIRTTRQRRAWWPAWRFQTLNTYARFGVVAAAVVLAAAIGIGIYANSVGGPTPVEGQSPSPSMTSSPSASARATPIPDPLVGTWLAAEVTCEQQNAAVEAAGFTATQIAGSGWTCPEGGTNHYSVQFGSSFDVRSLRIFDKGVLAFPGSYRVVSETTYEVLPQGNDFCITYSYAIDGDQLTIEMTDPGCSSTGEAPLNDQVAQTAIFETSPFTRQP